MRFSFEVELRFSEMDYDSRFASRCQRSFAACVSSRQRAAWSLHCAALSQQIFFGALDV
jgi:hypothetical protein